MIIARGHTDKGEQVIMLGLSRENVTRLTSGRAMRISRQTHGDGMPEGWEIFIYFGETEQAIADELKASGAIDENTKITKDPRL